jgi:hypothetical protein
VHDALSGPKSDRWLAAMESEINNVELKAMWIERSLPEGRKTVGCKSVW